MSQSAPIFSPVIRPVGIETEFGVLQPGDPYANAVAMASRVVEAYGAVSRPGVMGPDGSRARAVRWDYEAEDPLADLRGGHLDRAAAHPSLLTDDPAHPAPSGDAPADQPDAYADPNSANSSPAVSAGAMTQSTSRRPEHNGGGGEQRTKPPPAPWGTRLRPDAAEAALPRASAVVLTNGARLYVDHAHPEYSSPEVLTPHDAVVWDLAGELIARRAMTALAEGAEGISPGKVVLYKNNVDGKGATYGSHENYLVRRDLAFSDLAPALIPFLVTRPVVAGAGRVGIGQRSQRPGFQISQRADYVESDVGLQTTFNRPIVNTRDEPHADASRFRRLHIINGDANRFDVPIYLKVATTDLLLWYLERASDRQNRLGALAPLRLVHDPVEDHWEVSHDTDLTHPLVTVSGPMTALEIQRAHLRAIVDALEEDYGGAVPECVGEETAAAVALWDETLTALEGYASAQGTAREPEATARAAALVEWVAKKQLCDAMRVRTGADWDDPRLAALDIQWADLRTGRGIADRLIAAGRTRRMTTDAEIEAAADTAPFGTRAAIRGSAVARHSEVVAASWTSLVLDLPECEHLLRLSLPEDVQTDPQRVADVLDQVQITIGPRRGLGAD
jgi:proteasome component (fragment)